MRRSRVLVVGVLGAVVAVALIFGFASLPAPAQAALQSAGETWPSFVMVYREPNGVREPDGSISGVQISRLEYQDRHRWRLVQPGVPVAIDVGESVITFDHGTVTLRTTGQEQSWNPDPLERLDSPQFGALRWVPPTPIELQLGKPGYSIKRLGDGLALLRRTAVCQGSVVRTETTFRLADGLPLRRVVFVNGAPHTQFEVLQLELGADVVTRAQAGLLPPLAPGQNPWVWPRVSGRGDLS